MKKEFSVNLILLLGLNLLVKPLYIFGIDVRVQNTIGPADYGLFFSIFNYTLLFQILLEFGITNLVKRDIASTRELAGKYFSNLIGLKLILTAIYILAAGVIGYVIGYDNETFKILAGVLLIQVFLTFISFIRAILSGLGAYRLDSILSVSDKLIMIILLGVMIYMPVGIVITLRTFIWIYLISVVITFITAYIFLSGKLVLQKIYFRKNYLLSFLKRAMPYALITFLMGIYGRIDAVFLERILVDGTYQAGIYAAGFRLLDAYMMFALLFSNLLLPMLSTYLKEKAKMMEFLYFVLGLLMTLSIIGGLGCFFYRAEIGAGLYDHNNNLWNETLGLLSLCMIPAGLSIIMGASVLALGKLRKQNMLFTGGVILSVVLNLYLIPIYKSSGAAWTALLVNIVISIGQTIIFYRESKVKFEMAFFLRLILLLVLTAGIFKGLIYLSMDINWILQAVISGTLSLASAFMTGLIPSDKKMFVKLFTKS